MDTTPYNDYVLQSSYEAGWINDEQYHHVVYILQQSPGTAALDLMVEQGILAPQQAAQLLGLIAQSQGTSSGGGAQLPSNLTATAAGEDESHVGPGTALNVEVSSEQLAHMHDFLRFGVEQEASDIHLGPDFPPLLRLNGQLVEMYPGAPILNKEQTERLAREFLTPAQQRMVEEEGSVDFCYELEGVARFRSSVVRQRRGWESVFRVINSRIRTMAELQLPPVLYELCRYHNGLVLVTGAVGSGKSTTLAAMIQNINEERHDHIITLEDPIEYVFQPAGCQITQREVHQHTVSFAAALRGALRQDPDVIMVGEMRDLETISLAITASETGHLVLGTLHTSTAARTLDRLLDVFPFDQQAQIRTMVSESMRGIICQQLVPRADGQGRVLALEIMVNNPAVANLIREGKTFMLPGVIQTGRKLGMKLMDDSLMELVDSGLITPEEGQRRAENKKQFAQFLAQRQR